MKKKQACLLCSIICIIICAAIVFGTFNRTPVVSQENIKKSIFASGSDEEWDLANEDAVVLENNNYRFVLDTKTSHFTVTDKETANVFSSVSADADSDGKLNSELLITYYDSNSAKLEMNSWENSVKGNSFKIKTGDNAVRVYYSIRKSQKILLVPVAFSQKAFEEEIIKNLHSGQKRRLQLFYSLYKSDDNDENTNKKKEEFEALNNENLYILSDAAVESTYSEITEYMLEAGYSYDEYLKDAEKLNFEELANEGAAAAFTVPIEYTLNDDGFNAKILSDKITSDSTAYKLTDISLLPYFACTDNKTDGYFMVPDGSGAIVDFSSESSSYTQKIYSRDYAIQNTETAQLTQNAVMPVFGCDSGSSGFFGIIEGAAAVASVNMETCGKVSLKNHIYTSFNVLPFDTSSTGELRRIALFNIYSSDYVYEAPSVRYILLRESNCDYSAMAKCYRDYLVKNKVLKDRLSAGNIPLYIDFTGYQQTEASILGISYKSDLILSTVKDIKLSLEKLHNMGVENVNVRLKAYNNNGVYQSLPNGFGINRKVGSIKELGELSYALQEYGSALFLENNINTVFTAGNSFDKLTHSARNLNKTVATSYDYDLVARKSSESINTNYLISPIYYESLTNNFTADLKKKADTKVFGYSWSNAGLYLWSDFNSKNSIDRCVSENITRSVLNCADESFRAVAVDGGNAYTLGSISVIMNIPLSCSKLTFESYSIPFYQMVIHGYVDYSGAPLNISADSTSTFLASIESGANPYYSCFTADNSVLKKNSSGSVVFPSSINLQYSDIEENYKCFNDIFGKLRGQFIVKHERLENNVYKTTYEDGTAVIVNYSAEDVYVNEKCVKATSYIVVGSE